MPWNDLYVLEVVRITPGYNGKTEHIGYMKAKFKSKKNACSYYNRHNPHMRSLNALGTYESDWDPHTKLRYIVRKDYMLDDTVMPFSEEDIPIDNCYKYLK